MQRGAVVITVAAALAIIILGPAMAQSPTRDGAARQPPADTSARRTATLDTLSALWANNGFNSIIDGQPNPPGRGEVLVNIGWLDQPVGDRPLGLAIIPAYTPAWTAFFRNMQVSLPIPLQWGHRGLEFGDLGLAWQQRWVASVRQRLMLATYLEVSLPTARGSSGVEALLTGVAARVLGPGVAYLSGTVQIDSDGDLGAWGFLTAYKFPFSAGAYLTADYFFTKERGEPSANLIELSAVGAVGGHLTIGPGVVIGIGHREVTPRWGAGVRLTYVF